jgi:CubicO group peptidase (beta-lactamase class C family)
VPLRRRELLSGAAAAIISTPLAGCVSRSSAPLSSLQAVADEAASVGKVPGLAVLEVRSGRVVGESVWGVREAGTARAIRRGGLWHIGSNAKPITATLIARLVERGVLAWSGRLQDLLPNLLPSMRAEFREATLLELVTHRSGLPPNGTISNINRFEGDRRPRPEQRLDYLGKALMEAPAGPRGVYHYSNMAFVAAGAAAERVTGQSFEHLMRTEIAEPLRMSSLGFGPTPRGEPLGHVNGRALMPPEGDNPLMWAPAGGLHMSLGDWAKFAIDQMVGRRGGGRLLKAEGYAFLQTAPEGHQSAIDWGVDDKPFGKLLMHAGSNGRWYALTALAPDLQNAVIVATNIDNADAEAVAGHAFDRITSLWASNSS